jgi:hypothetical protein
MIPSVLFRFSRGSKALGRLLQSETCVAVEISRFHSLARILANRRRKLVLTPDYNIYLEAGSEFLCIVPSTWGDILVAEGLTCVT